MASSRSIYINPSAKTFTLPSSTELPPVDQIINFHSTLSDYSKTPLTPLPKITKDTSLGNIYIKDERKRLSLPSFKPLGISWAIRNALIDELSESLPTPLPSDISLPDLKAKAKEAEIKLITATDGKLGRIVARLGKHFGVESINTRIFVPEDLDEGVVQGIKDEGAEVIVVQGDLEVAVREAWLHSVATDGVLVSIEAEENYEEFPMWITQGHSTLFHELSTQLPPSSSPPIIILPLGIGTLAQAAITYHKSTLISNTQRPYIVTVEPEAAASLYISLLAGQRTTIEPGDTVLNSLKYPNVAEAAWKVLKDGVDVSLVVSDAEVGSAADALEAEGLEVGSCSAAVLAGLRRLVGDGESMKGLGLDEKVTVVLVCTDGGES